MNTMERDVWHYWNKGEVYGPCALHQIKEAVADGRLSADVMISRN